MKMYNKSYPISQLGIRLIEELGRTGIKILLILYEEDNLPISEIWRRGVGHSSFYNALITLKSMNLVKEERKGNMRLIKLTPLGREVAEQLKMLDQKVRAKVQAPSI